MPHCPPCWLCGQQISQSVSQSVNVQVVADVTERPLLLVGSVDNRSVTQSLNVQVLAVKDTLLLNYIVRSRDNTLLLFLS